MNRLKIIDYRLLIKLTVVSLIAGIVLLSNQTVLAQTATPTKTTTSKTPTPTSDPQDSQIEKIKDLVASRVAELKLVDKRGLLGTVKNTSNNKISIESSGKEKDIEIDELTKFESANNSDFGISDVSNGDLISAVGLYNKQTEKLLARYIEIASYIPRNLFGVVSEKDAQDFTLTVTTTDGKKHLVNVETSTKSTVYEDGETIKSGFTRIETGEKILVVGFADKTNKEEINASRLVRFPDFKE